MHLVVENLNEGFDLCRERNYPIKVLSKEDNTYYKLFPSGRADEYEFASPSSTALVKKKQQRNDRQLD